MFKTVNRQVPEHISEKFAYTLIPFTDIICGVRNTISSFQDHTLRHRKKSFWYRGAVLWNSLSVEA